MAHGQRVARTEALVFLGYYALFMVYNSARHESDPLHWLSLVAIPFGVIYGYRRLALGQRLGDALASVGLRRGNLLRGLPLALAAGLALGSLQLLLSDRRTEIWALISSGRIVVYLPLVIVLLALTAGFTEEFFFRGVLQTRLASWLGSELWALLVAALLFGLYHLPYVLLGPGSGLSGDLVGALVECGYDALGGILIGLVYWRARHNLLAAVTVHVLIDAPIALTMLHMSLRF